MSEEPYDANGDEVNDDDGHGRVSPVQQKVDYRQVNVLFSVITEEFLSRSLDDVRGDLVDSVRRERTGWRIWTTVDTGSVRSRRKNNVVIVSPVLNVITDKPLF